MPCDQVRLISAEIKDADSAIVQAASESLGHRVVKAADGDLYFYDANNNFLGQFTGGALALNSTYVNDYKKAYATQLILAKAKKAGYKATINKKGQILATKVSY